MTLDSVFGATAGRGSYRSVVATDLSASYEFERGVLEGWFGRDVGRMVHQAYGHGNLVFLLPDLEPPLIAKTSWASDGFLETAANVEILSRVGVPTPEVVDRFFADGLAVLLLKWIPGRDLGHELTGMTVHEKRELAAEIVAIQGRVGTLPLGVGYGYSAIRVPGSFGCWADVVERDLLATLPEYHEELSLRFEDCRGYLEAVPATPFLDDITVKNVIVDGGRLAGIVDLDLICYGDPLYWLALTECTVLLDVGDGAADYSAELKRLWGSLDGRALGLYRSIFAAQFLSRGGAGEQGARMRRLL